MSHHFFVFFVSLFFGYWITTWKCMSKSQQKNCFCLKISSNLKLSLVARKEKRRAKIICDKNNFWHRHWFSREEARLCVKFALEKKTIQIVIKKMYKIRMFIFDNADMYKIKIFNGKWKYLEHKKYALNFNKRSKNKKFNSMSNCVQSEIIFKWVFFTRGWIACCLNSKIFLCKFSLTF